VETYPIPRKTRATKTHSLQSSHELMILTEGEGHWTTHAIEERLRSPIPYVELSVMLRS